MPDREGLDSRLFPGTLDACVKQTCLVNLVALDPPRNGGTSRTAWALGRMLAKEAARGRFQLVFAVSYRFAEAFPAWLGLEKEALTVIPCEDGRAPFAFLKHVRPRIVVSPLFGGEPFSDWTASNGIAHVAKMPDALVLDHPEHCQASLLELRRRDYENLGKLDRVVTSSEFSRERLLFHRVVEAGRLRVIPLAGDFESPGAPAESPAGSYLFYPANGWPHKRHALLFRAFGLIRRSRPDLRLVLSGWMPSDLRETFARESGCAPEALSVLGFIPDAGLKAYYRGAEALLFVSEYEGFGMPVLEAMAHGCPVLCSGKGSLPEVAGDAALVIGADAPEAWAEAFLRVLPAQREVLVRKGRERAGLYRWENAMSAWKEVMRELGLCFDSEMPEESDPEPEALLRAAARELAAWAGKCRLADEALQAKEACIQDLVKERTRLRGPEALPE